MTFRNPLSDLPFIVQHLSDVLRPDKALSSRLSTSHGLKSYAVALAIKF